MIRKILKKLFSLLPLRNIIIFESSPDLSDSSLKIYNEMLKRNLNRKYKLIWICFDEKLKQYPKYKNVEYISVRTKALKRLYYYCVAKAKICGNNFFISYRNNQKSFYIMHGSPLKDTREYYILPKDVNYVISAGLKANYISAYAFNTSEERFYPLGYPRNDDLLKHNVDLKKMFGQYKKFIVWYPTVRQYKNGFKTASENTIPLIHNENNILKLNEIANKNDILIILKPHFRQEVSYIKQLNCSNIKLIDDSLFKENNITSYEFVGSTDALISDYSSIYYDYLLVNKPIGLILEDIELYRLNPGLIAEFDENTAGGEKIYTISDLCEFISNVGNDIDILNKNRNELCFEFNTIYNSKSVTEKVTDFIIEKANLK